MIFLFSGPSFPGPAPRDVIARPPAARGDLARARDDGATVIGLVDGVFGHVLAVSNAEVRDVARSGVTLFGAASMGALRAVECPDAMSGIGWVYEQFRSGALADDDEVALTFTPDPEWRPLTVPLVRVRYALALAGIDAVAGSEIVRQLKLLSFDRRDSRTIAEVVHRALSQSEAGSLVRAIESTASDVKANDARELVRVIHDCTR